MEAAGLALPRTIAVSQPSPDALLTELMDRYERRVYAFMMTVTGEEDLARDCTQDAFIRAYRQLEAGKEVQLGWLFTVARNRAIDEFRRRKRARAAMDAEPVPIAENMGEEHAAVREALALLSPGDQQVLYLFAVAGFSTEEISGMLGVRPGAVRQRLVRARERFRNHYVAR